MSLTTLLVALVYVAGAIWLGGLATILVVVRAAGRSLPPAERVMFLRELGRGYLPLGGAALVVLLGAGFALLLTRPWDLRATLAVVLGLTLAVVLAVGVRQARLLTRLRQQALNDPDRPASKAAELRRVARRATVLRTCIAVLTLALFATSVAIAV